MRKYNKRKNRIIVYIFFFFMFVLLIDWYKTNRLENFLKETLSREVSSATHGFYNFKCKKLSISLVDGNLLIKDIELVPNPTVFRQWQMRDSLPPKFYKINIGTVHFRGVNLTWKKSFEKLDFSLLEIKNPSLEIYESISSKRYKKDKNDALNKDLYGIISPYMSQLVVRKVNLEHAYVRFISFRDGFSSTYAVKDADFHAYNFHLNKNSSKSGKLLYCDNFDFNTNLPQRLLSTQSMVLHADKIRLSTKDSIIDIQGVRLEPPKGANLSDFQRYLNSHIQSVKMEGIDFRRENSKRIFKARLFEMAGSDINYYNQKRELASETQKPEESSSQSLYDIISPLISSVQLNKIGVKNAKFNYVDVQNEGTNSYKLDNLNFESNGFKVDSVADKLRKFLYSDYFLADAKGIDVKLSTRNQQLRVGKFSLNSSTKNINISEVAIGPIQRKMDKDYFQGSIQSLNLENIHLSKGLKIDRLILEKPAVEYVKIVPSKNSPKKSGSMKHLEDISPLLSSLSVGEFAVRNGSLRLKDYSKTDTIVFNAPQVDVQVRNFLFDNKTIETSKLFFLASDYKIHIQHFDNLLANQHNLKIENIYLFGPQNGVRLEKVQLKPDNKSSLSPSNIWFTSPLVVANEIDFNLQHLNKISIDSIFIQSPKVNFVKNEVPAKSQAAHSKSTSRPLDITFNQLAISDINFGYLNQETKDDIRIDAKKWGMSSFAWNPKLGVDLESFQMENPSINLRLNQSKKQNKPETVEKKSSSSLIPFRVKNTQFCDLRFNLDDPDLKVKYYSDELIFRSFFKDETKLALGEFRLEKPDIDIHKIPSKHSQSGQKKKLSDILYTEMADLAPFLQLGKFDIVSAEANYHTQDSLGKAIDQHLHSTDVSLRNLDIHPVQKTYSIQDFGFKTNDLSFPISNGFYTLSIGELSGSKSAQLLHIGNIHMDAKYPKMEFAYKHPKNEDWFDVTAGDITLGGLDFSRYLKENQLHAKSLYVADVYLQNLKNQKIQTPHNVCPMIYDNLHKIPVNLCIDSVWVKNFNVIYEELPKNGTVPGKLLFTEMDGVIPHFANYVTDNQRSMKLDAHGKLMGKGPFEAQWTVPIDSTLDQFTLKAHLHPFDLQNMNELIVPLASVEVGNGAVEDMQFSTIATSKGANGDMLLLYNGLKINYLKLKNGELTPNKFVSSLINHVLKRDNVTMMKGKSRIPRTGKAQIVRDPYHSTFNYFWQILQPPLAESVGVSQGKIHFVKKLNPIFNKVKSFFKKKKKK